ncbi:MAG: FAD-dependent oxidoreductase [Candidatus Cybelea sp.]
MQRRTFAIVGAGVAAAAAADTLRSSGFDGRLVIVGGEPDLPYDRPALSKQRLRGEVTDEQVLFHPADYYQAKEIELLLGHPVTNVDVTERRIQLENGDALAFDAMLLATGAQPQHIRVPGSELGGIHYLRSLSDSRRLNQALQLRPRVLVLGTGFIGCEVAASARALGCEVKLVGRGAPLAHVLGEQIGNAYAEYHRGEGVDVRVNVSVERFEGDSRVERARLSDGSEVPCDVVVIGIGVSPSLDILHGQPVQVDNGIFVDEFCHAGVPGIFAAGDVASSWNPRFAARLRVEHFYNAQLQAVVAARAMLGPTEAYNPIPSFWSDQYSYKLQYRGYSPRWNGLAFRGQLQEGSFSAFYLADGLVEAICSVNRDKENFAGRGLIGKRVDPKILEDDAIPLREIASAQHL